MELKFTHEGIEGKFFYPSGKVIWNGGIFDYEVAADDLKRTLNEAYRGYLREELTKYTPAVRFQNATH